MSNLRIELAVASKLLVLIGGGEFSFGETREIDEYLLAKMPSDRRTIAFLPTASGSAEYARHFGAYLKTIDASVDVINVPVYRGRDARRQKNLETILTAGMVYLGGGVTNNLVATLRETPADMAIREAASNGAVIAAIGAAAASFGTNVRDMRGGIGALASLSWLTDTVIDTAFEPENDTMLRRLMSVPGTRHGLGIPAATAIAVFEDGATEIIGSGQIAAFRRG